MHSLLARILCGATVIFLGLSAAQAQVQSLKSDAKVLTDQPFTYQELPSFAEGSVPEEMGCGAVL